MRSEFRLDCAPALLTYKLEYRIASRQVGGTYLCESTKLPVPVYVGLVLKDIRVSFAWLALKKPCVLCGRTFYDTAKYIVK